MSRGLTVAVCLATAALAPARAEEWLDRVQDALTVSSPDGRLGLRLSGRVDAEYYDFDGPPPGVLDTARQSLSTARLCLYLDAQLGDRLYGFAQARIDEGFDPADADPEARLDEYALRYTPWDDGRLSLQAGAFATIVGRWVGRHDAWENPFVNAPLAYEQVTPIRDTEAPASAEAFGEIEAGERYEYNPIVWGPSYASGASAAGRIGGLTYAAEVKNAGLSSRPADWPAGEGDFAHPHRAARIGYQPNAAWDFGFSAAEGPYYADAAADSLPPGRGTGDYRARTLGQDAGFAWRHIQIWAEVFEASYDVPRVGRVDAVSYFIETKLKLATREFVALRWNEQLYGDAPAGGEPWGNATWRIDAAAGHRLSAHAQLKLQYSLQREGGDAGEDEHLLATQASVRF